MIEGIFVHGMASIDSPLISLFALGFDIYILSQESSLLLLIF